MFSKTDFQKDNLHRLCVITMHEMGQHPLTQYSSLSYASQKEFEHKINGYIKQLPADNWLDVIVERFNNIIHKEIFDKSFRATEWRSDEVITDVQHLEKPTIEKDDSEIIMSAQDIDESAVCEDFPGLEESP